MTIVTSLSIAHDSIVIYIFIVVIIELLKLIFLFTDLCFAETAVSIPFFFLNAVYLLI